MRAPDGSIATFDLPHAKDMSPVSMAMVAGDRTVAGTFEAKDGTHHGYIRHADGSIEQFDAVNSTDPGTGTLDAHIGASGVIAGTSSIDGTVTRGYVRMP